MRRASLLNSAMGMLNINSATWTSVFVLQVESLCEWLPAA